MRDRLIDLLWCIGREYDEYCDDSHEVGLSPMESFEEMAADHLLAEGVIFPPMRLGQTCYKVYGSIDACRVSSITQKADGSFKIRLTYLRGRWVFEISPDQIGKTVFLTKEEAEKALAERRDG